MRLVICKDACCQDNGSQIFFMASHNFEAVNTFQWEVQSSEDEVLLMASMAYESSVKVVDLRFSSPVSIATVQKVRKSGKP